MIDRPAPLEINRKIATMGGGDSHLGQKKGSLCSASVCFLGVFCASEKVVFRPTKNLFGGKTWAGPPNGAVHHWPGRAGAHIGQAGDLDRPGASGLDPRCDRVLPPQLAQDNCLLITCGMLIATFVDPSGTWRSASPPRVFHAFIQR